MTSWLTFQLGVKSTLSHKMAALLVLWALITFSIHCANFPQDRIWTCGKFAHKKNIAYNCFLTRQKKWLFGLGQKKGALPGPQMWCQQTPHLIFCCYILTDLIIIFLIFCISPHFPFNRCKLSAISKLFFF